MNQNRSKPAGTIIPTLIYDDVPKAVNWLCDVFGFTERLRAGTSHFRQPRPAEVSQVISVDVEDVDSHHEHAVAHGARILQPPTTHMYGERQYTAEDYAGYRWTFSQTVTDVDPADWGALVANQR
jgi:uncharacterized glyoxalase superfamily protein PhnB